MLRGVTARAPVVLWWMLLAVALVVHVQALYGPVPPGEPPFPWSDKVVHVALFLVPTLLAGLSGIPHRLIVRIMLGHAVVSEAVQGLFLSHRSGDPLDLVADTLGVVAGMLLLRVLGSRDPMW